MGNDINDISDVVKKCKILLLDIEGTTTSISFVKDKLFPYAEENVKEFLTCKWESDEVKEVVAALRKLAIEDKENNVDGVVVIPGEDASKEDQIEGLVKSVKWQMSSDRKANPLKSLQGLIWKQGYDSGDIKGHVYDDVSAALELWRSAEGQKVYIYSSGSVQAQKLLFGQSSAGDLLKYIDGHFDTAVGAKQETASYAAIAQQIDCKPDEILFLTDIAKEAEAARASGFHTALVSREGNAPLPADVTASYPVLHSFAQLAASNKRKPDAQDSAEDVQPAKVPKTDVAADVKTASETEMVPKPEKEAENTEAVPTKVEAEVPEKMEVEEDQPTTVESSAEKDEVLGKVETIVEEITDPSEMKDAVVCDAEPVIEESTDKTEEKETEKMDTESTEVVVKASEVKGNVEVKNGNKDAPIPEETPPTISTEIEDITNDKENLNDVADMIEDLQPVVEEQANQDLDELQNVGDVLEKECDEILSKVQDVTNLDSIPVKPLLNSIAEESLETENTDSNDIVDRILDTEMDLDIKQSEVLKNGNQADDKPVSQEEKNIESQLVNNQSESVATQKNNASEESKTEDESIVTEKKEENETQKEIDISKAETVTKVNLDKDTQCKAESEMKVDTVKVDKEMKEDKEKLDAETKQDAYMKEVKETMVDKETRIDHTKSDTEAKAATETEQDTDTKAEVDSETKVQVDKTDTEEKNIEADKTEPPSEQSTMETDTPAEAKENGTATNATNGNDSKEMQMNGKTTNGDSEMINLNGDASKEDELSSRLSMENGKEKVNGANGDSNSEQSKTEINLEVADIKVKTVPMDEPRNDPIEQPTEA